MNMYIKFQVDIFKKWLRYDIDYVTNRHFHVISGLYRDFPNFIFLTDFDASKMF